MLALSLSFVQLVLFGVVVIALVKPLGGYMTRVFEGERSLLSPVLRPVERAFYGLAGIDPKQEQHWAGYLAAGLVFNFLGILLLYALLRLQNLLPLNPKGVDALSPDQAFNTAISFVTNTNWQPYAAVTKLSPLTLMAGLTVQNFLSAATAIAFALALVRAFARSGVSTLGNFWVDMTRAVLYLLLPLALVYAVALIAQGVPQTLDPTATATTLEGATQTIALGPIASEVAIRQLATSGGGLFAANAAHPFENPTPLTNMLHMIAMVAIGAGLTNVFGRMVKNEVQGWSLFGAMAILFAIGAFAVMLAEYLGSPLLQTVGADQAVSAMQAGGNMEGKEVRFGPLGSALFSAVATTSSAGALNAAQSSFTALGGMLPMIHMMLGEIIIGGVGTGLSGMILFAVIAVFVAGLMVGRTPEYLGKKIAAKEVKMTVLATLVAPVAILGFTAMGSVAPAALEALGSKGPHGFSELLYAYTSTAANNGSAFASLKADSPFFNVTTGLAMLAGRFGIAVPMMALAGSIAAKRIIPTSSGSFPTDNGLFVSLLIAVILILGGLIFFPALALGPIAEHLLAASGTRF